MRTYFMLGVLYFSLFSHTLKSSIFNNFNYLRVAPLVSPIVEYRSFYSCVSEYEEKKELKKRLKKEKKKNKHNKHYASTLSSVHEDVSDESDSDTEKLMHEMHRMQGAPPMAGGQMPMAGSSPRKHQMTRQDSGWGDSASKHGFASSTPQRGKY